MSTPNVFENKLNDKLKLSHERIKNKTGLNLLEPKEPLPNTNPHAKGTIEHDQWSANLNQFNKARGSLFGTTASGLKQPSQWYDKTADKDGLFTGNGEFIEKPLSEFSKKQQDEITGKRKKIVSYAVNNNLYSPEDWESHEIKDKDIQRLWNENKDIQGIAASEDFYKYLKLMKDYGFSEPELKALANNKKKELINTGKAKDVKPAVPVAPLVKKPLSPLPTGDPIEEYKASSKPKKQGEPLPIPTPLTLDEEEKTPIKAQGFPKMDYGRDYDIGLDKDPLKGKYDLNKAIGDYEREDLPKKIKRQKEYAENTYTLDSLVNANISLDYDDKSNTVEYSLTDPNKSYDDVLNELYNVSTASMDKAVREHAKKLNLSKFETTMLVAKTRREYDAYDDKIRDEVKNSTRDNFYQGLFGTDHHELPQSVKDIGTALMEKQEQLRILKSKKAFGESTKIEVPKDIDLNEVALSLARGASPSILNKPLGSILQTDDFDLASGFSKVAQSPQGTNLMPLYLLTDPRKIFSKDYTDSEAMQALLGIYNTKYNLGTDDARREIQKAYKDIDKEQDSWGHTMYNLTNAMGELTGELLGPFKLGTKGFDAILDKGAYVKKFVEGTKISKLMNTPQGISRGRNIQRILEGKNTLGGKITPYFDEVFGFAPTNVARVTAASFGSQMFWHGADVDEAIASAENMAVLETFNQSFALAGLRAYKFTNAITKALRKSKGTKFADDLALGYQKKLNAIYALSSFPAQGLSTALMNPEATDKEFASEMLMNLFMTGNNLMAHRGFNKQLKEYKNQRNALEREASNYASESPNREKIVVTSEDLKKKAKEYSSPDKDVQVGPPQKVYNEDTGKLESQHTVVVEKVTGFHDFAREVAGKNDKRKKVIVNDFKEVVKENIPEDLTDITEKIFAKVGGIKIETINDSETTSPAYYDRKKKTIVFNNAVDFASNTKDLTRAVVHEGVHALTDDAYINDKTFRDGVDETTKELLDSDEFQKLVDELEASEVESDIKAYNDISYAMQSPEEMIALMFDPGMKEGRDALSKLKLKREGDETPKSFIDRIWDSVKKLFGKESEETNDYIKRFRDIVEGYDYEAPIDTKKQNKSNTEPIQRDIDNPVLLMPELVNANKLNEYNEVRKESGLPELNSNELVSEYRARYGTSPNGIKLDLYMDLKKREMSNKSKGEDSMSQIVNDISKGNDYPKEGFVDKSKIQFAKEVFGVGNMSEVYEKSQGKSVNELTDMIKDKVSMKYPDASQDQITKIATYQANRLAQKKTITPVEIIIGANGFVTTAPIRTDYYDGTKPVDKTIGVSNYLNSFVTSFPKSFRNANGELRSYVPERIDKFFSVLDPSNITKIGGINSNGKKSSKITEGLVNSSVPKSLISQGYFVLPRGAKSEVMWKIPGLGNLSRNHERAIDFAKQVQAFSFHRWLDSDSQWIGSKEGAFKGRTLAELGGKLDFDKMLDKYVKNQNVAFKDLFTEAQKGEINNDDIDLIGTKLKQYYMDAEGQHFVPQYRDIMSVEKPKQIEVNDMLLNSITDLMTWGLDSGGASRTLTLKDNVLNVKKSPWKYHSILATSDPLFGHVDYAKPFLPDAIKEDGNWDENILKEKGLQIMSDGNLGIKAVFPNELMFAKNPMAKVYFSETGQDGASHVVNENTYKAISDMMLKDKDETAIIKPKWQHTDENGNMFIYKTAMYDYGKDEYNNTHNPDIAQYLNTVKDAVSVLSFDTSSKGSNTYRAKQENLLSTDNPNAKALFDATGNIVDVIVKKDGEYKSDKDLLEKEIEYMQDQWAKGIVDPRSIVTMPITGDNAVAFIESSHPISSTNAGATGINQTPMANSLFDLWQADGGKGWEALENFENNVIANSKNKIEGAYELRNLIEGNEVSDVTKLKKAGEVVDDIISEIRAKIDKGDENDEFMLPGMTNTEALELLESTLDTEGKVIPQNLNNLFLAGNLFVNGMKYAKPGEKTMLQYQVRDYFSNAMLTRGYGANTYLMPDMESKSAIARMWEPMIEDLISKGEYAKADAMGQQYLEIMQENIDENGRLKPFSKAVIVGNDVMDKLKLKPGDKAFLKLTPTDDLHSIVPVVIAGVTNKPGVTTFNTEYLTQVIGRDFDKDNMQIVAQNDKFLSREDFDALYDLYDNNGMREGRYKVNAEEIKQREKESVNGVYKALGEGFEYENPTKTPQSKNIYSKIQDMHGNVGSMITNRNVITNAIRNIDWAKDKDGYTAQVGNLGLRLDIDSKNGTTGLSDRINTIVQKMVDKYDHMPFNPDKAIYDELIGSYNGREFAFLDSKTKAEARKEAKKIMLEVGGYGINAVKNKDNLQDVSKVIQGANIEGNSVASKVGRMMTDIQVPISNRPEINKYKFNNKVGQEIQKATLEMEKQYADKLDPLAYSFLFNAYRGSNLNIGQHFQELFKHYTNNYLSPKANEFTQSKALNNDIFSYVSTNDFGAFTQGHKWKDIAAGTALHDYFSKNSHKHPNLVKNKVFRGGYEYQYDGYNGWIAKGDNKVKLDNIFAENGDLKVDWLDGQVLSSEWIRNLVQRKSIVSDNAKAELIGRTIGNVSKYLSDAINSKTPEATTPGELFTLLAYNSTGNVNQVYRNEKTKAGYDRSIYDWVHGKPKKNKYDQAKMKEVANETSKEMRYDPLYLMQGAKSIGVTPIVNGKDALSFMKEVGAKDGIEKHGPITGIRTGEKLGMPELRYKVGGLNINSPKKFVDSINELVGKAQADKVIKDLDNMTRWSKDDYKEVFDKVLDPALKKLIKQKGTDLKWRNETIELATRQYLNNFGPKGMDAVIENIKKNTGGDDFNSTYVAQLAILGRSLENHFNTKEGSRLSFLRPLGDRSPISMLKDYTLSDGMANYSGDRIIAEQYQTVNGKLKLLKDAETKLDILESTHYKVSDLPDVALNISSSNMTLPKSLIEFVEPRNFIEKISQSGEANIKTFKEKRTGDQREGTIVSFDKDIRNQNNKSVSDIFNSLRDDDVLSGIINEVEISSGFNGIIKSQDTQAKIGEFKRNTENDIKEISDEVLNRWTDKEIESYREEIAKQVEEGLIDEADIQGMASKKDLLARAEEYRPVIENAIRLKALAQETANTLLSLAATVENVVELRQNDIDDIQAQEIYVATKRLKDKAELLNSSDFRDISKEFRSLDYTDGKTIDMFNEMFYDNSQKHMNEYREVYDTYKENWGDKKYVLTKDNVPFVFDNLYAKDNIPLFPYLANRFLKHIDINEIETGQYKPETEKSYKAYTKRILKSVEPDIKAKELNEKANQMWSDLKGLTEKRFNINTALYEMGHKMGFTGHETPLAESEPENVFKMGYKLRKELTRQYENKLKQIQDYYEIDMVDFKEPNLYMSIQDREIDLEEIASYARPHLIDNSDIFKFSVTNFKDKIKRDQNAVISAVENAFKTAYIKKYPNEGKVAEAIVMSELGKVTNDKAIYNQHYDKKTIKEAKIEPGTDSYVRYMTKSGRPITAYGRILGTRDIVTKKEKNFDGSERVETNKFLFLQGERQNGGKLYVINTDNIHDAVTGEVYGARYSQPVMYNKKVKEVYAKNTNGLLDDIAKSLGEKSKFDNRKASDKYVEMVDRNEEVRSNIREKRMDLALEGFQDAMVITDAQLEKSFPERLKNGQKLMKDLIIADTYMGLRYIGTAFAGVGVGVVGGLSVGPAVGLLGLGMATAGTAKYGKRIGRIMISNLLGNLSWVSRNTNNKKFLAGNAKEIYEATRRNLGIGVKDNNSDQSDAIAKVERLELEEGIESNRAAEMIDEAIYKNDNLQSKGFYDILKERKDAKLYSAEMKKINEQVERYKRNSEDLNQPIQEFLDQTIKKYAEKGIDLEFKNDIPFINGKAMTHYQARELSLMNIASHYLSWKGHFIDYEIASTARAQKNVKQVLNEYYNTYEKHINNHAPNKFMYKHNTNTMLAQKSIGNYKKSTPQRNIMNTVAETFSRFAHLQKLDQTAYAWERYKMYDTIMGEFQKDKDYQQWKDYTKELGGIPLNDYKIQSPKKELAFNLGFAVMSQAMKLAGLLGIAVLGEQTYSQIEDALDTNEEYFGSAVVANDIIKTGLSAAALLAKEDGKSPRSAFKDLWWNTSSAMGGFVGYGISTPLQEALVHTEMLMYNHYNDMSYLDKQKVKKYMDKLQKEKQYETVSKVLPIPVVNELIKSTPKIEETAKKDK